jgi:ribosomal protein S27AE
MADKKKAKPKAWQARKSCPKCGAGVHLAEHAKPIPRRACGRCGYTEMLGPAPAAPAPKPAAPAAPRPGVPAPVPRPAAPGPIRT